MNGRAASATDRANGRRQLTPWQARVLQQADDIVRATRRELAAWRDGFRHGRASREDDYERGFHDGVMALKRAQHDVVALARLEHERWGSGGRKRFGQARPGGYPGGPKAWLPGWDPGSGTPPPGWKPADRPAEEAP